MQNRITGSQQFCVSQHTYEKAVACWWHDRVQAGLWSGVRSFNDLPQLVRELYFSEARMFCA